MFFVKKSIPDRNCDKFIIYVSASNVLGESERAGVEGMFPIGMKIHIVAFAFMNHRHNCIIYNTCML